MRRTRFARATRVGAGLLAAMALALTLAGCANIDPARYRAESPPLDLRRYFNGTVDGWGMVQDRDGVLTRRFHVVIDARWEGDTGVLDERFVWSDGSTSRRVWTLTDQGDGRYLGRAEDVVGAATGLSAGPALSWRYTLQVPVDGRVWELAFDDWMFLIDEHTLLNRATMHKWGLRVGEVTLAFRRRSAANP